MKLVLTFIGIKGSNVSYFDIANMKIRHVAFHSCIGKAD